MTAQEFKILDDCLQEFKNSAFGADGSSFGSFFEIQGKLLDQLGMNLEMFCLPSHVKLRGNLAAIFQLNNIKIRSGASGLRPKPRDLYAEPETVLFGIVKRQVFSEKLKVLKLKGCLPRRNTLWKLSPLIVNGIIQIGRKLTFADQRMEVKIRCQCFLLSCWLKSQLYSFVRVPVILDGKISFLLLRRGFEFLGLDH